MAATKDLIKSGHLLLMLLLLTLAAEVKAQKFSVDSFRVLANDVTAFVDPVEDLNGDACALIKIECAPDFAFSTPLGIVKRTDKTGEIWLYLPKGSKRITIKHPKWGIIRDYTFPEKLDSHKSYEIRISQPSVAASDFKPAVTTVRDTLLVVRTDTLMIEVKSPATPFTADIMATAGFSAETGKPAWGILATSMRRAGGFLHIMSDFGAGGSLVGTCDRDGDIGNTKPFYSGETRRSVFIINAGPALRLSNKIAVFAGVGYGFTNTDWQLARSEGGGYVRNSHLSVSGVSVEAGFRLTFGRISTGVYASSVKGRKWWLGLGVGIRIGKKR